MSETDKNSERRPKGLEGQIKVLTLQDCSGERFPRNKNRILGYRNPVKYYGKKITKSRI